MPAQPADIAAASRDVALSTWSDATIAARYPSARDGSVTPSDGYFDDPADATAVINARGALIGVERRRFTGDVAAIVWLDPVTGAPRVRIVDVEQRLDAATIVTRLEVDLEAETTSFEVFG